MRGEDPEAIAATLKARLAPLAAVLRPTPMELLVADIARKLTGSVAVVRLETVVDACGGVPPRISGHAERFAYAIANWALCQHPSALRRVAEKLRLLGNDLADQDAKEILGAINVDSGIPSAAPSSIRWIVSEGLDIEEGVWHLRQRDLERVVAVADVGVRELYRSADSSRRCARRGTSENGHST
jgi:hypothetical protein